MIVCGIAGSLRKRSFNRALLQAARDLAPAGMEIRIFDRLGELPHYNGDLDTGDGPEPVMALRNAIGEADALLLVSPEYNYSIPGVLKNAIDWASRPVASSCLKHKPCAIMGASGGIFGTLRGQLALRQSLHCTETRVLLKPEVFVGKAPEKFDADLKLIDETTREHVAKLLVTLQQAVLKG